VYGIHVFWLQGIYTSDPFTPDVLWVRVAHQFNVCFVCLMER
jgi:hypothetical protein